MTACRSASAAARALVIAAALFGLVAATAPAAPAFPHGDVFFSVSDGMVQQFAPNGTYVATLKTNTSSATSGSAFNGAGELYVTSYGASDVFAFTPLGTPLGAIGGPYREPNAIVFDAAESFYVSQRDVLGDAELLKLDASGTVLARYPLALETSLVGGIDLAADQCTLHYVSDGVQVKRFDVCTGAQRTDFAVLPAGHAWAVRLLADGGVLVASGEVIYRLDGAGNVLRTYDAPGSDDWAELALDPDDVTFWGAGRATGKLVRFGIAGGEVISAFNPTAGFASVYGLSVAGEPRAAKRRALTLTPASAQSPPGETATVSAHVTESGTDEGNAEIIFTVTGAHAEFASRPADATGRATFSYPGESAGTDTITACADLDASFACEPGEPVATAARTWTAAAVAPPPPPPPPPPPAIPPAPLAPLPALTSAPAFCAPDGGALRLDARGVTASTTPRRDRLAPHTFTTRGAVLLPHDCGRATRWRLCRGTVTVSIKRPGRRTISARPSRLYPDCTFRGQVTLTARSRLRPGTLRVHVRFEGNALLAPKNAPSQAVVIERSPRRSAPPLSR